MQNQPWLKNEVEIQPLETTPKTRNIIVAGRRTSVRLEPAKLRALFEIAPRERCSIHDVCTEVAQHNDACSLTAGLRVHILEYYRDLVASAGLLGVEDEVAVGPLYQRA